jgi:integrase
LWEGLLDLGWHDGKRRRRVVYGSTRQEVQEKLAALRRAQQAGLDLLAPPRTVGQWLDEWLNDIKAHDGTRPTTLTRYRGVVQGRLKPALGSIRLDKLAPRDVQRFMAGLLREASPGSVAKVHGVLRAALSDAERFDLVTRNVAKHVRPPRQLQVERRALTVDEACRFLAAVRDDGYEAVFVVALVLGLRRGEVLGLRWVDVDLAGRSLRVVQAVQRAEGRLILVPPKTARSRRSLPLPRLVVEALERQRKRQQQDRQQAGPAWQETGLVFTSSIGTPVEPRNLNRRFAELRQQAGLPWLRLHDLRHGCATFLLAQGVEPRTVMEVLGHSTYRLTMDRYGHALPERMRVAADVMDATLGGFE